MEDNLIEDFNIDNFVLTRVEHTYLYIVHNDYGMHMILQ